MKKDGDQRSGGQEPKGMAASLWPNIEKEQEQEKKKRDVEPVGQDDEQGNKN